MQWFSHGRLIPCTNVKDNHQVDFGHLAFNLSAAPCLQPSLSDRRPLSKWAKHSRGIPERNKQQSTVRIVPTQLPVTANKEEVFPRRKFFKVIQGIWQFKWDVSQSYTWNLFSCNGHFKWCYHTKGEERMTYLGLFICILFWGKFLLILYSRYQFLGNRVLSLLPFPKPRELTLLILPYHSLGGHSRLRIVSSTYSSVKLHQKSGPVPSLTRRLVVLRVSNAEG